MKKTVALLLCLVLPALMIFSGCEGEEEKEYTAEDWIEMGLGFLARGDGTSAYLAFSEARKLEPANLDAKYGQVLSDVLQLQATLDLFVELLGGAFEELTAPQWVRVALAQPALDAPGGKTWEPSAQDEPLPATCKNACDRFEECGFLEPVDWTIHDCRAYCPTLYEPFTLECFLAAPQCELAVATCFPLLGTTAQMLMENLLEEITVEMFINLESILAFPEWNLYVPAYNFTLTGLFFDLGLAGENDLAEAYLMNAITNGLAGFLNVFFALNLDFNENAFTYVDALVADVEAIDLFNLDDLEVQTIQTLLRDGQELIDVVLNDPAYPAFLSIKDEIGLERFREASVNFGMVFDGLIAMIDWIDRETDEQWDDAIRYEDANQNGAWDNDELLIIPGVGSFEKELILAVREVMTALKINFIDGVPFPLNSLNDLLAYLNVGWLGAVLDVLYVLEMGEIDLADSFRNPQEDGLRPFLESLSNVLGLIDEALSLYL